MGRNVIPDGYELVVGHSRENARQALSTAEERGLEASAVLSIKEGYLVPLSDTLPDPVHPPATVEEARERKAAAEEAIESVEAEEIEIPDPEKASHADIDAFAQEWGLTYEGIEAANAEKPTKAEKVTHLTAALEAKAAENDATAAATGELTGTENEGE